MWIPAARAQFAGRAVPYPTCLTNTEWALVQPFMPHLARPDGPDASPCT